MITVTIAGVDKSSFIDWDSLSVEQQLTSQVDSARFHVKKYGTKNYAPSLGDSVTIDDGATRIFGGTIVRINNEVESGTLTHFEVECVSHERTLDRYLVAKEITNKSARYIINTIFAEFVNRVTKVINSMESTETWTQEDGTVASNTTAGQFIYQDQSRKFTATASSTATGRENTTLDLTTFDDGSTATTSDLIKFWAYVDTPANLASIRIRCGGDTGATYTNYYEYTYSTALVAGWNEIAIAKSAFSATGSPNWNDIKKRQFRVTATAAGTVNVSIDDVRLVQASTYFPQTGVANADSPTLGSVKFNYEQVTSCIKQVAEAVGNDWYIDPNRVLYFYQGATVAAPFALTDTSANFLWNTLKISTDTSTIRNQIYVRGGEYQGSTTDFDQSADGTALNFRSPFRLKNIAVTVAAASKTVGVDNLDDPASYDCLYNYQEKTLKFKTATKPTAGQTVRMTGNPMIPVIIKRGDATSIAANGIYEYVIVDKSIITQQGARDRASAELRNYRANLIEGSFTTDTSGLRAGQTITINITARGINDTYIIKSVTYRTKSPTDFFYDVKLVSTRTFGIIEYLLTLLRNDRKQIVINDNEVVDLVQNIDEEVTITDTWTQASTNAQTETMTLGESEQDQLNHGTIFVFAPYTHANFADTKRAFILAGSLLG